jgi:hypothetical protein
MNYFRFLRGLVNEPAKIFPEIYKETRIKSLIATYTFLCIFSFVAIVVYVLGLTISTELLGMSGSTIFLFIILILLGSAFAWFSSLVTTYKILRWRRYKTSVLKVLKTYLIPQVYLMAIPSILINLFVFLLGLIAFAAPSSRTALAILATCPGTVLFVGGIWSLVLFVIGIKTTHNSSMKAAIVSAAGAAVFFSFLYLFATAALALLVGIVA